MDANIPLLLGTEDQKKWGMMMDSEKQETHTKKSIDGFKKEKGTNHWILPIQKQRQLNNTWKTTRNTPPRLRGNWATANTTNKVVAMNPKEARKHEMQRIQKTLDNRNCEYIGPAYSKEEQD